MNSNLIWMPALLVVVFSIYFTFKTAASFRKDVVLNVTLPKGVQTDRRVEELIKHYALKNNLLLGLALIFSILILLVTKVSLIISLLLLTIAIIGVLGWLNMLNYSNKLRQLKEAEKWFVGETEIIHGDLLVSREKDKIAVSFYWFSIPLIISSALYIWQRGNFNEQIPALTALFQTLLCSLLWLIFSKERSTVRSTDSEVNLALTRISIRSWTLLWLLWPTLHSVLLLLLTLISPNTWLENTLTLVPFTIISIIFGIIWTTIFIKRKQEEILQRSDSSFTVDQDQYWPYGFYYNPNDTRVFVEKRLGYGKTINYGTTKGKWLGYGNIALALIVIVAVIAFFGVMDSSTFTLSVEADQIVVKAPIYGVTLDIEDVESAALLDVLPSGVIRTNGAETAEYMLGNFTMGKYGKSKVYVYKDHSPYLVLRTKDIHLFFNSKVQSETERLFSQLTELLNYWP